MGFLKKLLQKFCSRAAIRLLPAGSMTVDRNGQVVITTVSSAYSKELLNEIGGSILSLFREARDAQMPLSEVSLHFGSLRITGRELRGGAVIFLFPHSAISQHEKLKRL